MVPNPSTRAETAQPDGLDDLFDYDPGMDDIFKQTNEAAEGNTASGKDTATGPSGLGIDEEVKITKKRQPIAKLDETRLLSSAGIPKLRRISKDRLKFRDKGHEFTDIARLLNTYQLWLDDLYPRAKFADGLAIIEKLGHTKRIQMMRKEWINEGKPRRSTEENRDSMLLEDVHDDSETVNAGEQGQISNLMANGESPLREAEHGPPQTREADDTRDTSRQAQNSGGEPDEDELDALLSEDFMQGHAPSASLFGTGSFSTSAKGEHQEEDEFADEMEVMAGMDDMWYD